MPRAMPCSPHVQGLAAAFAAWYDSVGSRAHSAAGKHAADDFRRNRQLATVLTAFAQHALKVITLKKVLNWHTICALMAVCHPLTTKGALQVIRAMQRGETQCEPQQLKQQYP
jgi:hypothetical protein